MKSCLKQRDPAASSKRPACQPRTVSFRAQAFDEVHVADEWDRSPAVVNTKLSYDDILELKQMQIDIRRACVRAQHGEAAASKPFLAIPLPVIPLLCSSTTNVPPAALFPSASASLPPTRSALSDSCSASSFNATGVACGLCSDCIRRARSSSYAMRTPPDTPPRAPMRSIPAPTRARNFTFLPLLESPPPPPSPPAPPAQQQQQSTRTNRRWNACLDSDVDQSSDDEGVGNDGWPSNWPGSRRSPKLPQTPLQQQKPSELLPPTTPPSPPAEVHNVNAQAGPSSYFAPVTFKANANIASSNSPTKSVALSSSPLSSSLARSPTRTVSPKLPPLSTSPTAFSLVPPNSPPSPPSPSQENALLDLRKCSLEVNTSRPKPKQFKFVPLA